MVSSYDRAAEGKIRLKSENEDEEGVRGAQPDLYPSTASQ